MAGSFRRAERRRAFLKLAVTGPSGSGKTYSSLLLAKGLLQERGKVAVIDTENGSASLYAGAKGIPEFDVLELEAPYEVSKYRDAIREAAKAGYTVLVIDSLTHAWAGDGGLLDQKELLDRSGRGNSYTNWATITKQHEHFKADILQADVHIIATMRSKQDYVLEQNDKGKQTPKKVGMAPIQREGMEYEFTTVLDLGMNHSAIASKDRTGLFDGKTFIPSEATGKLLMTWLQTGVETNRTPPKSNDQPPLSTQATPEPETLPKAPTGVPGEAEKLQLVDLLNQRKEQGWTAQRVTEYAGKWRGVKKPSELPMYDFKQMLHAIKEHSFESAMNELQKEDDVP